MEWLNQNLDIESCLTCSIIAQHAHDILTCTYFKERNREFKNSIKIFSVGDKIQAMDVN